MDWFRLYKEIIDDPKIAELNDSEFRVFIETLCVACEAESDGKTKLSIQKLAWRLRRKSVRPFSKLLQLNLIREDVETKKIIVTSWESRQFSSDSSVLRVRKHRENKKKCNVTNSLQKRDSNAIETEAEQIQRREDKNIKLTLAQDITSVGTNENYLALLEKYFDDISLKHIKVFRMFVSWKSTHVIAEDIENAIAYAKERGTQVVKPWYFEKAVIDFAKSRQDRSSDKVQTTAGAQSQSRFKTRDQQIAEHNERVKREFLESPDDEN